MQINPIAIVGQGSIGSIIAARCEINQYPYSVVSRAPYARKAPLKQHYSRIDTNQSFDFSPAALESFNDVSAAILPLKAYQIIPCLKQLSLPSHVCIVLLHNGMGTTESARQLFPHNPLVAGITSYAAFKKNSTAVVEAGQGTTQLGWIANPEQHIALWLASWFEQILGPSEWHHNIEQAMWEKLAVNAIINPLTAIHDIPNGSLQNEFFSKTITDICREITRVMQKLDFPQTSANLLEKAQQIMARTAHNYSSMHQDIAAGRRTEIDYINGFIVDQAQQLGVNVPVIRTLMQKIKVMESSMS